MYRNTSYSSKDKAVILYTWDENGNRVTKIEPFRPYLYIETGDNTKYDATSIFGTKLLKKTFDTDYDRRKWVENSGMTRIFHNLPVTQQYLLDKHWKDNEKPEFVANPLKYCFFDIEVYAPGEFPAPEKAAEVIDLITIWNSITKQYTTWGLKPLNEWKPDADTNFVLCESEKSMLLKFIEHMEAERYDVWSHFNGESFDVPYIINRIINKLGEEYAKRLSPTGRIRASEFVNRFGKTVQKWTIDGVSNLDYLELYRKFTFSESESYKLNAIAYKELGATKTDYGDMSLVELSDNFWDKYVEYNIQDVRLIVQLDQKLEFIALMRMLAAFGLCEMQAALGTVSVVNGAAAIESFKRGQIIPTFVIDEGAQVKIPGAYVAEPKQGFATHVMSFDANSLYPSVMISLNLSPETKFGKILSEENGIKTIQTVTGKRYTVDEEQFKELLVKGNLTLTKANILFSKKTQGIIPKLLDYYYKQRVQAKNSMKNCKKKVAKIDEAVKTGVITAEQGAKKRHEYDFEAQRLHLLQLTIKIFLNSVYGYMVNKFSACGDPEIGASVTLTGQTVVKAAAEFGFDYIESQINRKMSSKERDDCWTYSDTDSVYLTFNKLFKENNLQYTTKDGKASKDAYRVAQECEDYINAAITKFAEAEFNTSDSRFMFKRESIADGGIFLQKKRYILHSLDDEGVPCDKYKYVGVEVNRTATPKPVKDCIKHITETMIRTQSKVEADKVLQSVYEEFQTLDVDEIAITSNIKDIAKYNLNTGDLKTPKGCPWHVKAAHNHNYIVRKLNISHKYADIVNGDKIRIVRLRTPNAYDIKNIAYTSNGYPKEFANILKPDVEELFDRLIFSVVERMYDAVKWTAQKPSEALKYSAEDLFI